MYVYAKNLEVFVDAVKDTDCKLNASSDIDYLLKSITNFNSRDVMGLVVLANPMTKKCVELIQRFDSLFVFKPLPIIIINDFVHELWEQGKIKVKHSNVYLLQSEDNSISDLDVRSIFTTLLAFSDNVYDLSQCSLEHDRDSKKDASIKKELVMSEELSNLLKQLEGGLDIIVEN